MLRPVTTQAHATATAAIPASMAGAGRVVGNVREYPEFFTLETQLDGGHLNAAGAEVFTHTLARLFVEKTRERTTKL